MRCKSCDYALWNLTTRQCPECGTSYRPDEFEFVPNSVQFCCPQCGQAYYGTDAKGHLVPPAFNCVTCGRAVQLNDMVLRPAVGVQESQTQAEQMPWLERRKIGSVRAWFAMIGMAMTSPYRLMRVTPVDSSAGTAWWYAVLSSAIFLMLSILPIGCAMVLPFMMSGGSGARGYFTAGPALGGIVLVATLAAAGILPLWAAITHGLLRLTGPTQAGFGRTLHGICYSTGANALMAVPCLGVYLFWIFWIWWVVSATLMVKEAQNVHGGRATIAVVTFPILLIAGIIGLIAIATMYTPPQYSSYPRTAGPASAPREALVLTQAILNYASSHNGAGPRHAAALLTAGGVQAQTFLNMATNSDVTTASVGDMTLAQWQVLPLPARRSAIRDAEGALPASVIAHRIGDFVFTYHGIDLSNADSNLWIVILSPDPVVNVADAKPFAVGFASGVTRSISGDFDRALRDQNELRARFGLRPLPDPQRVTHENPATAASTAPNS